MTELELDHATKVYADGTVALHDACLRVPEGEVLALLGSEGAGKSVILQLVAGLEDLTQGRILMNGAPVHELPPRQRDVGLVVPVHGLYPHLTVAENLAFPLRLRGLPGAEIGRRIDEIARRLGVSAHLERRPAQLAAGQRRRVALGRALVRRPGVLLLDEPLADLDPRLQGSMRALLRELHEQQPCTTVHATQDPAEAFRVADRVAVLDGGVIHQVGTPAELDAAPASVHVARLVGDPPMNLFPGSLVDGLLRTPIGDLPLPGDDVLAGLASGAHDVVVGLPPRALRAESPAADALEVFGTVDLVERMGSELEVLLTVPEPGRAWGGTTVTARVATTTAVRSGERVRLWCDPAALLLFDAASGLRLGGAPGGDSPAA